eukprot:348100_1
MLSPERRHILAYGYVRDTELLLNNHRTSTQMPYEIYKLIFEYFFMKELFDIIGSNILVSKDGMMITKIKKGNSSSYGSNWIPTNCDETFVWKIKINKIVATGVYIGISADHTITSDSFMTNEKKPNYSIGGAGEILSKGKYKNYGKELHTNDLITMELDCDEGTLSYDINTVSQGVAYDIDKTDNMQYKLAIFMFHNTESVTIVDFQTTML